jgi:hypothetical protein
MTKEQMQALGIIESPERKPKFESDTQIKEYEQALIDVHKCADRKSFIHSKRGLEIVLLYMKVWEIPAHQAMRELINDDAYACYICP